MNFTNIVSHNLKNYAHGFSGLVELLIMEENEEGRSELISTLKTISDNFVQTIKNLNEIVHVQNINEIELRRLNISDYIFKALSSLKLQLSSNNAKIENNVLCDVLVLGNPAYIESILVNLISNAIKYKHPNHDPIIEIDCKVTAEKFILTVSDNGRGIDMAIYGKDLFGMYKTFHGNSDAQGIGLYITKLQVEAMGGHITAESQVNKGTTFIIEFKRN